MANPFGMYWQARHEYIKWCEDMGLDSHPAAEAAYAWLYAFHNYNPPLDAVIKGDPEGRAAWIEGVAKEAQPDVVFTHDDEGAKIRVPFKPKSVPYEGGDMHWYVSEPMPEAITA